MNIEQIKERLNNITSGKWKHTPGVHTSANSVDVGEQSLTWDDHGGEVFRPEDAEFIAHAPEDMTGLIEAVEAFDVALDQLLEGSITPEDYVTVVRKLTKAQAEAERLTVDGE